MGCISSTTIGSVVLTLTPLDNLDVGSFEFIYSVELTAAMFKKKKNENSANDKPEWCLTFPQLNGAVKELSIEFALLNTYYTVETGKIELSLVRGNEVIHSKELFQGTPMELTSGKYGYKIANPLVNLSQAGDCYQLRIFLH